MNAEDFSKFEFNLDMSAMHFTLECVVGLRIYQEGVKPVEIRSQIVSGDIFDKECDEKIIFNIRSAADTVAYKLMSRVLSAMSPSKKLNPLVYTPWMICRAMGVPHVYRSYTLTHVENTEDLSGPNTPAMQQLREQIGGIVDHLYLIGSTAFGLSKLIPTTVTQPSGKPVDVVVPHVLPFVEPPIVQKLSDYREYADIPKVFNVHPLQL